MKPIPMHDVYWSDGSSRRWFRLVPSCHYDLDLQGCADDTAGEPREHEDPPLPEMPWSYFRDSAGNEFRDGGFHFAMEHGIAPWQPFEVAFDPVQYSQSYDGEWDSDQGWVVERVMPWRRRASLASWERFLRNREAFRATEAQRIVDRRIADADLFGRRLRDVRHMFIGHNVFGDMEREGLGIRVHLCSTLEAVQGAAWLIAGEDKRGDWSRAMAELIANVTAKAPWLTAETIRALRIR